jgi:hypothetical protein
MEVALTLEEHACAKEQVTLRVAGRKELVYEVEEEQEEPTLPYTIDIKEMFVSSNQRDCPITSYQVLDG